MMLNDDNHIYLNEGYANDVIPLAHTHATLLPMVQVIFGEHRLRRTHSTIHLTVKHVFQHTV